MADSTESSIVIAAAPHEVMGVIADVARYPEWTDGMKSVEILSTYEDAKPADVRFVVDTGAIKDAYCPRVRLGRRRLLGVLDPHRGRHAQGDGRFLHPHRQR